MIKPSRNGSANLSNYPRTTGKRKIRTKKKMLVHLYFHQKTDPLLMKTRTVLRTTGKTTVFTTARTPFSTMLKTARKKLHRGTKANCRCQNCRRVQTTKMRRTTEPVPRTLTPMATAMAEVTGLPAREEGPRNG